MDELGWDSCDIIIVTGDAYVDHPSFGMAIIGRLLEAQGFRVGIISQPDWSKAESFTALGKPNLFFGITAGNMDSMVNHYTSDRRIRRDDSYTPSGEAGKRPDRAVIVYSHACRAAYPGVPIVIGGIEASLRRIAQYDHWTEQVRRSVLFDAKADLLVYGNAERAIVEIAHRAARRIEPKQMRGIRGTAYIIDAIPEGRDIEIPKLVDESVTFTPPDPYATKTEKMQHGAAAKSETTLSPARETTHEFLQARARVVIWCGCQTMKIWWWIGCSMPMLRGFCTRRVTPAMLAP